MPDVPDSVNETLRKLVQSRTERFMNSESEPMKDAPLRLRDEDTDETLEYVDFDGTIKGSSADDRRIRFELTGGEKLERLIDGDTLSVKLGDSPPIPVLAEKWGVTRKETGTETTVTLVSQHTSQDEDVADVIDVARTELLAI